MFMIKTYDYWTYAVGVFVAWAVVLLITWQSLSAGKSHTVLIFGSGFLLGVLAASLARKVYR